MAYDEYLAGRIRSPVGRTKRHQRAKDVWRLGLFLEGNEAVRVQDRDLVVRVNRHRMEEVLENAYTMKMDSNHILVLPNGILSDGDLKTWVER